MIKKIKALSAENMIQRGERTRLEGLVFDLSKIRDDMGDRIQRQTNEIKVKNGQLKKGIAKQVRSEEQIHLRTKAMESTTDGIFIIDALKPDFPVVYANRSFKKMIGYVKMKLSGGNYYLVYAGDADHRLLAELKNTILRGKAFHGEMFNFIRNGKKHSNLLRIAPVHGVRGVVTHYIGLQTDVTLVQEREFEIAEQREQLLHVTRVGKLAEFVSSLAHEISQPLTAILAYAQAAQRMLDGKDPEVQEILSFIINDDQRAAGVIQRLRSLLKKSVPEMKPLDINTLLHETMVLIATDATVRKVSIKLELASGLPGVLGDRIQLQQVLLNLISNSFEALENERGSREIAIRTSRKDVDTIIVAIKDSGSGIDEENMSKLFKHFFTSKPDGLGMGLSISRSIIEAHGGKLYVENNADRGVTFFFTLPVKRRVA